MASFRNVEIDQERSCTRPALVHGYYFAHWKKLLQIFIKDLDYELWEIIINRDLVPTVNKGDKIILKSRLDFSTEEIEKVTKNYRALNILFCGLNSNGLKTCVLVIQPKKSKTF